MHSPSISAPENHLPAIYPKTGPSDAVSLAANAPVTYRRLAVRGGLKKMGNFFSHCRSG